MRDRIQDQRSAWRPASAAAASFYDACRCAATSTSNSEAQTAS